MSAPARAGARVRMRRPGVMGPRGGGVYLPEVQRTRLLDAAFSIVAEQGHRRMTVRRVSGLAGMSSRTFYDLVADPEDCFLAVFDRALDEFAAVVVPAWEGEREWAARIRAGLSALLAFLDREPELRRVVFVEALGVGPRVLARRAEALGVLEHAVDGGRVGVKAGRELPALTAEGVVGAAFGLIHARLVQSQPGSLVSLLNPLMATIVLPYRGRAAAERELSRPVAKSAVGSARRNGAGSSRLAGVPSRSAFRPTLRTHMVLAAVAERPGANNRQVSDAAGVSDQGQMSRLLARLEGLGLLRNTSGQTLGAPYAWHLTPRGEEVLSANRPLNTTTKETR